MKADDPENMKPKRLDEEQRHNAYSVDTALKHYKESVYYNQRKGGAGWFHGRITNNYRSNYDQIDWGK